MMIQALRQNVVVQHGGHIEIDSPELPEGAPAEVIVMIEDAQDKPRPMASMIGAGKGCFSSVEEIDALIRKERDSWED